MFWFLLLALAILLFIYAKVEARRVMVTNDTVYIDHFPQELSGLRVGFISDIHVDSSHDMRFYLQQLETMKSFSPDLLLLAGDYSNDATNLFNVLAATAQLEIPMGIVAVRGNHDRCVSKDEFSKICRQLNIQTNFDDLCYVKKNGQSIAIACLDDFELGNDRPIDAFKQGRLSKCTICLTHQPKSLVLLSKQNPQAAQWIDAAFCGHTHAGQVTFFGLWGLRTHRRLPIRKNQWVSINGIRTFESNGIGQRWNIRFFARPQIHCMNWFTKN